MILILEILFALVALNVTFNPFSIPDWITIVNSSTDYVRTLSAVIRAELTEG